MRAIAEALAATAISLYCEAREGWYPVGNGSKEGQRELLFQDPDGYLPRFSEPLGARDTARAAPPLEGAD